MRLKTLSTAIAGLALMASTGFAQSNPTVAVLYLNNAALGAQNAELAPLSKGIADMLISSLAANPGVRVVERDRIQAILDEQKLATDGKLDQATSVRVGKIVGARHMIAGTFMTEKDVMKISLRVFDTETSELVRGAGAEETGKTDAIMALIDKVAAKLNTNLKLPMIPAQAREQHAADMKRQAKVPFQAVMLYSRALDEKDHGNKEKAVTLFNQAIAAFPNYEAPKKELQKLGAGL